MLGRTKAQGRIAPIFAVFLAAVTTAVLVATHQRSAEAQAGPKTRELFEKYDLLGVSAADCSSPADGRNVYRVYRALGGDHVQVDQMSGPSKRDSAMLIDRAAESKPNEVTAEGTIDGQRFKVVMRIEEGRSRVTDINRLPDGAKVLAGGEGSPWFHKCAQKITLQSVPDAGAKCIDVPYAVFKPGTPLNTWDCNGHTAQTFSFDESTGRVTIGGLCVDAGSGKAGERLRLAWCNGQPNQAWKTDGDPNNARLVGVNGLCIDISNYMKERGAPLGLWHCHNDANQRWQIRPGFDLTYEENANYDGATIEEFETPNADAKNCQWRCVQNAQCAAWVYRTAEGRTNGQPYCWLRNKISGTQRGGTDNLTVAGRVRSDAR